MTPGELEELTRRPGPGRHDTTIRVGDRDVATLADLPPLRDHLLFVGLRPSPESIEAGHHQQGRTGRAFWRRLMLAGILPPGTAVETADDALVGAGHGITDLRKWSPAADDETDAELTAGVGPLWQRIAIWRPAAVVFIDRRVAMIAAGRDLPEPWGHLQGVAMAGRPCVLLPGPDASAESVEEGVNFLRNLAASLPRDRA
jgi:hypothetical protein